MNDHPGKESATSGESFRMTTSKTHISDNPGLGIQATTSAKEQRTPYAIEILLRRYNQLGITNWNEILERLHEEEPSVHISRSTLGEYLKECNIGTSRKNQTSRDDKREVVLLELQQPRSQKCGVRKVWKNLKANGHHITREFVESVMKEVDPDGFSHRRPKWTSTGLGSNSGHLVPGALSDSPLTIHSDLSHSGIQMHPYLVASPATAELLQMIETQDMTVEPTCASEVFQTGLDVGRDGGDSRPSHPAVSTDDPALNAPIQEQRTASSNSASPFITRGQAPIWSVMDGFESTIADAIEDAAISEASNADSDTDDADSVSTASNESSLDDLWEEEVYPLISGPPPPGFWKAMANASVEDQITQIRRLALKNAVRDLLVQLDKWCADPVANMSTPPVTLSKAGTLDMPIQPTEQQRSREDVQRNRYAPDYNVPEEQVTNDALIMVLNFQHILLRREPNPDIVEVSDQLWEVFGRLEDIGMARELLAAVSFKHLKILNCLEKAFGCKRWILQELRSCAASFLQYSEHCSRAFTMARRKATEAAAESTSVYLFTQTNKVQYPQ